MNTHPTFKKPACILVLMLIVSSFNQRIIYAQSIQELYQTALTALESKQHTLFLETMLQADSIRPNHPTLLYQLGKAYTLNQKNEAAYHTLKKLLWLNSFQEFETDSVFNRFLGNHYLKKLSAFSDSLEKEVSNGQIYQILEDKELHHEGLAIHPTSKDLFVSSIRKRKIVKVKPDGTTTDFAIDTILHGIMGMQIDSKRNLLWVCSTSVPQMLNYKSDMANHASIIKIDLTNGKIIKQYSIDALGIWLGDLVLTSSGEIYTTSSSSEHPAIYKIDQQSDKLVEFVHLPELISLQGITLNQEENKLFIADYRYGIYSLSLLTKEITPIENKAGHPLKGIDGLYFYNGNLIGIHNGLKPYRIVSYQLDKSQNAILDFQFLEKAVPQIGEPTLGKIVDNTFYYVANSPWGAYGKDGKIILDKLAKPIIRKVDLQVEE